ncbi:medium chain dehydrogenase/reductase family protein [Methylocystis echinoides]|uniref:synaptic vesicle VAT-1 family membrane protein n=1 Tax=Methylocystis echinoides TaxID=29468 RepID=UPI0034172388
MRQVWITRAGRPEVLQVKEAPDPTPQPGELRIRVEASGVNFADVLARLGIYPDLPGLPAVVGYEVGGRVDAVGAGVDPTWIGRDVFAATRFGGYSDLLCVPENQVFLRPSDMSAQEGAALPVNYLTAWQLVVVMGGLKSGETMLVHSAGGGVGIAATQIAKHLGARVIGVASQWKHAELAHYGADHLIDPRRDDLEKCVRDITRGRGVELILDPIAGSSFKRSFRMLGATGRLGMFGVSSFVNAKERDLFNVVKSLLATPLFQFMPMTLINANKGVFGVNLGRMWGETDRLRLWAEELRSLWEKGAIRPRVDKTFSFDDAALAHHYLQDRKNIGKVLLTP